MRAQAVADQTQAGRKVNRQPAKETTMTTSLPADLAELVGPVAAREFANAADHYKPGLIEWALALPTLNDAAFLDVAGRAIYDSALVNSFGGNWEHHHFKATACYREGERRNVAAGHDKDCRGETLYSRAHARVMGENGYQPLTPGVCTCRD